MVAVETRQRMPAGIDQLKSRRQSGFGGLADEPAFANATRQFFHAEHEMDFLALQTFLAQRSSAAHKHLTVVKHEAKCLVMRSLHSGKCINRAPDIFCGARCFAPIWCRLSMAIHHDA